MMLLKLILYGLPIIGVFVYYIIQARKIVKLYKEIEGLDSDADILSSVEGTSLQNAMKEYSDTINIQTDDGSKSNYPASEILSLFSISKAVKLNLGQIDTAAGTLVGLGLLGTFIGLTIGVSNFDSSDAASIQNSIEDLLGGMGTAFSTSLAGMCCSLIFIFYDKRWRNRFQRSLHTLTEKLDDKYYIDDIALATLNQSRLMTKLYTEIEYMVGVHTKAMIAQTDKALASINEKLEYNRESGERVTVGNAVREILAENSEQTKALKSFSTDLAIELNNGFDEVLSRQMQAKIIPLMENVDKTTNSIVDHIDKMTEQVSSPAGDLVNNLVDELKSSMTEIVGEFKNSVSSSATQEFENLAAQLGTATRTMADFPKNMADISSTLQITIEQVKSSISEISNKSATANSNAMQQMQEQIAFATSAIGTAITEVKEVMSGISQTSQQQNDKMVSNLADASQKMSDFLNKMVSEMSDSVKSSIKGITDDVNSNHEGLIRMQENVTEQTKGLLSAFTTSMERLEKINEVVTGTMEMFQQAQGHITGSTSHLQNITGDMKTATEIFNKSQVEFNAEVTDAARRREEGLSSITKMMTDAGTMSKDYAGQFEIIKEGLKSIFAQLQTGMNEYSNTVQSSTQKYLTSYTTGLTSTTDTLSSAIQMLNDVVEQLADAINTLKK